MWEKGRSSGGGKCFRFDPARSVCEAGAEASPRFAEGSSRCLDVDWRGEVSASGSRFDEDWRDEVSASGSRVDEDWRDEVFGTSRGLDEDSCNVVSTSGRPDEQSRTEIACPGRSLEEARCKAASASALPARAASSSPDPLGKASATSVRRDDQVPSDKLEE